MGVPVVELFVVVGGVILPCGVRAVADVLAFFASCIAVLYP